MIRSKRMSMRHRNYRRLNESSGYDRFQEIIAALGTDDALEELLQAMSEDELNDYADYIERTNDLDIADDKEFDDDEEFDDEEFDDEDPEDLL